MSNYSATLRGIGIENFKAFGEYQYFELAPITIITGPNNSGKSALVAALDLLSKSDFFSHLEFHSFGLEIGDLSQVVNKKSKSDFVSFHLNFEMELKLPFKGFQSYNELIVPREGEPIRVSDKKHYVQYIEPSTCDISLFFDKQKGKLRRILIKLEGKDAFYIDRSKNIIFLNYNLFETLHNFTGKPLGGSSDPILNEFEARIIDYLNSQIKIDNNSLLSEICGSDETFSLQTIEGILGLFANPSYWDSDDDGCSWPVDLFKELYPDHTDKNSNFRYNEHFTKFLGDIKEDIVNILKAAKSEIHSVGKMEAQRASRQRVYLYQEQHIPLTREIITAAKNSLQSNDSDEEYWETRLKKWTGKEGFNLFDDYEFILIPGVGYKFEVTKNGERHELPDLGFGTRQVIPVILGSFNNRNNPFIIEEPESNLHPRLQSLLADLFVDVKAISALFKVSPLIIETHSEYLIRKLQYLVAKQEISMEDIAIHYIGEETAKGRDIFKINIDKDGSLDRSFGPGFFDEATNWKFELMRIKHEQKN